MSDTNLAPLTSMAAPKGRRPVPANCTVDELQVDATYQRGIERQSISLIRSIASVWDWTLCQPLIVARRSDDSLWVVDGQHRLLAARLRGDIRDLPCIIVHYGSVEAEATGFVALNTKRRPLTPYALWKAALAGGDADALALEAMLTRHGLGVASGADFRGWKPSELNNIARLQSLFKADAVRLERVLSVLARAFPGQVLQYGATFVGAIDRLMKAVHVDDNHLCMVIGSFTQARWMNKFEHLAADAGLTVTTAPVEVLRRAIAGSGGYVEIASAEPVPQGSPVAESSPGSAQPRRPMTHDERMAKVALGAKLVPVVPLRRADPDMTLGGVGSAMC